MLQDCELRRHHYPDVDKGDERAVYLVFHTRGRGISVKMLYDEVDSKLLPFDPANKLFFGPGF